MVKGLEKELKKYLTANSCHLLRQGKGDHEIWWSPHTEIEFLVKAHKLKSRHTANESCKQAGLHKNF